MVRRAAAALVRMASHVSVPCGYDSYNSIHNLTDSDSLHVYNDVVVMGIRLRVWFVGLQQRWSVRLRTCLSLVVMMVTILYITYLIHCMCTMM